MKQELKRKITKWDIVAAITVVIMGLMGGIIGYTYPDHIVLGKSRAVFIFVIVAYFILRIIDKYLGTGKKIIPESIKSDNDNRPGES
jgi:hypothetical protein